MFQPEREQARDMVIINCVKHLSAGFPGTDKMHLPQAAQLMGNSGVGHFESTCQRAHTPLAFEQDGDDTYAAGVT